VLDHVIESITPASRAHAEAARDRIAGVGAPALERLAGQLAAAQHGPPRGDRRVIVVCAGDHGAGDPGISLGEMHPTAMAARAIADGSAAVCRLARVAGASIVLVDAGTREPDALPAAAIRLGGTPSRDLLRGPALGVDDVRALLEAGVALAVSLVEDGVDVLALGALGVGSELTCAALHAAATGASSPSHDAGETAARHRGHALASASPLELLAGVGGPETCVLAGAILAAASMNVPVILDGPTTAAAALAASRFAPDVTGYLIAAHARPGELLDALGLSPLIEVGLGHGEGAGAAMVLPWIDQVLALGYNRSGDGA
jgi:nicotinate-nucleotide--dimethylbenzimidazole phosphoribosyltransferase